MAAASVAAGAELLTGFPLVWAQRLKDITLLQVGGSYSAIIDIARQATKDLGFKIEMQNAATDALVNRVATQPKSLDIADIEYWMIGKLLPRQVLQGIDLQRFKYWDKVVPIFTRGIPGRPQGVAAGSRRTRCNTSKSPTARRLPRANAVGYLDPDALQRRHSGIRPDLVNRPITHWHELFHRVQGRLPFWMCPRLALWTLLWPLSHGDITYGDKGNMTQEEIDKTIKILIDLKKAGHFRAFWTTFDESVNLMTSGEVVIQSMWSPAVTAVRARGIPCYYTPLQEGYRAWAVGLGLMAHLSGLKLDAAYEYLNWYQSGWQGGFIAKQGYYSSVPETVKQFLTPEEWDYWYEGKPAK